jgi:EmrB/QacA subfamily drug resistance transporter
MSEVAEPALPRPTAAAAEGLTPRKRGLAFAGVLVALTLSSLDQNIVGTALPTILGELGGLAHLSWVVTGFMLAATAVTPIYGKLSDLYGRRIVMAAAILILVVGSALCGQARSMPELIAARTLQGLGAGGIMPLVMIVVADLFSPRERPRYQGFFAAIFAGCGIAGPLLGGLITQALSWRWIFYVNLPIGALALAMVWAGLPAAKPGVTHRIDYAGAAALTAATTGLLLLLSWAGPVYAWTSPPILGLGAASLALFALFIVIERRATEPVLPLSLFGNKVFTYASAGVALVFLAMSAAFVFLPLFLQVVRGATAAQSGIQMAPSALGAILGSIIGGQAVSRSGRYKPFMVAGTVVATLCFALFGWAIGTDQALWIIEILLFVLTFSLLMVVPNCTNAIQNAVAMSEIGTATASSAFVRSLGAAVGVAFGGAIVAGRLAAVGADTSPVTSEAGSHVASVPIDPAIIEAYRVAIMGTFELAAGVTILAVVMLIFLPEIPLRSSPRP